MSEKLHIEPQYSCLGSTTYLITGFDPKEMDEILSCKTFEDSREKLADLLDSHDNDLRSGLKIGTAWMCGYGIYGIRHFGGNLLVKIGDSCD